ncbi:hypothetical protein Tco_0868082, partial [Tanacetum coccineum]
MVMMFDSDSDFQPITRSNIMSCFDNSNVNTIPSNHLEEHGKQIEKYTLSLPPMELSAMSGYQRRGHQEKDDDCTYFVIYDAKGNIMHATARSNVAHNFLKLKAGEIYSVKNFSVQPNKDEFRIFKDVSFIVEFDGETIVRKAFVKSNGFIRYPFEFVELENLQLANNKHMIDVVGYVTNLDRIVQQRSGSRTLAFY